jgi:hypothetical protein
MAHSQPNSDLLDPTSRGEPSCHPNASAKDRDSHRRGLRIGSATTVRLLAEGARVIATDVIEERLTQLADEAPKDRIVTIVGDVSAHATADALIAAADDRLDGLANIAGIMDDFLPAAENEDALWDKAIPTLKYRYVRTIPATLSERHSAASLNPNATRTKPVQSGL